MNIDQLKAKFPAEAALISDLSIGKLSGATAALESQLVGIPSVLIGPPRINYHPFFINSRNRVVFDDWQALRKAVEQFRSDRSSFPEFGNWASELKAFDPHTDGNASRRMGLFVKWLYDAFTHGKSKDDTLGVAFEKYTRLWL